MELDEADMSAQAGKHRDRIRHSLGTVAGARRRQLAVTVRKDRRDALMRAKRARRDVGVAQESTCLEEARVAPAVERLRALVKGSSKGSSQERIAALRDLRLLLSSESMDLVETAVAAGSVPLLGECLGFGAPEEQLVEASWCLTNIAAGETEHTTAVLQCSALLIQHLGERSPGRVAEQCAWAVGNLAAEDPGARAILLTQAALPALAQLVLRGVAEPPGGARSLARTAAWSLSNLVKGPKAGAAVELAKFEGVLAALVAMLSWEQDVAMEAAWVMVYISSLADMPGVNRLVVAGAMPPLVALLATAQELSLLIPVLRTIGNVTAGDNAKVDAVLAAGQNLPGGTIGALAKCLEAPHRVLQKEGAWALSNIAGGSGLHKEVVLEGAIRPLFNLLTSSTFDLRKEAAYALGNSCVEGPDEDQSNATPAAPAVRRLVVVVEAGCLPGFLALVRCPDHEANRLAVQFVELVLRRMPDGRGPSLVEQQDGIDALECLQFHENEDLRRMVNVLLDTYYGADYAAENDCGLGDTNTSQPEQYPPWRTGGTL